MATIIFTTQIVVNRCYGGFGLSDQAALELAKVKGIELVKRERFLVIKGAIYNRIEDIIPRNDPDLINIVKTLGEAANGYCARLEVKDVTITLEITDYDGMERASTCYIDTTF